MRRIALLIATAVILACGGASSSSPTSSTDAATNPETAAFIAFTDDVARVQLRRSPLYATSLGIGEAFLGESVADQLGSYGVAKIAEEKQLTGRWLTRLEDFDRDKLSPTAATTYDVMRTSLLAAKKSEPFFHGGYGAMGSFGPYIITQLSGPHLDIPRSLTTEHPLDTDQNIADYFARMGAMNQAFQELAELVGYDASKGIVPPRFAVDGAIAVIDRMTALAPADHPLAKTLGERLSKKGSLQKAAIDGHVANAVSILKESVYPGYATLRAALVELQPKASPHPGIWALPDGAARYQYAIEFFGASGRSPDDVHELGLAEVERIHGEMDTILRSLGHTQGGVIERYIALTEDPKHLYADTADGKKALLEDLNGLMNEVAEKLPTVLGTLPKAGVEVRAIPTHEQDSSAGGYYTGPTIDGSRPGIYWINLKSTKEWPTFALPSLTYHEASPGHHLQVTIAQEIKDMPMVRNLIWFGPYGEGWALYAERLAQEMGLYEGDALGDLGRLQSELFRAARLVVDTGLHHKKWTREQAIDYMHKATGEHRDAVTREVERYSVWPGQACSYKLGQLKILELREQSKKHLGDAFDLREFHDQVLTHGPLSLTVLTEKIHVWLQQKS